jgi:hypothetical protein
MNEDGDRDISEEERTNEVGLFNTAESYWRSAGALYEAQVKASHPLSPVRFLYYHAIELYLKAFLRGNGHSARELRAKRHIYPESIRFGLGQNNE